jgi:hypothetical protein
MYIFFVENDYLGELHGVSFVSLDAYQRGKLSSKQSKYLNQKECNSANSQPTTKETGK